MNAIGYLFIWVVLTCGVGFITHYLIKLIHEVYDDVYRREADPGGLILGVFSYGLIIAGLILMYGHFFKQILEDLRML